MGGRDHERLLVIRKGIRPAGPALDARVRRARREAQVRTVRNSGRMRQDRREDDHDNGTQQQRRLFFFIVFAIRNPLRLGTFLRRVPYPAYSVVQLSAASGFSSYLATEASDSGSSNQPS